MAEPTELQKHEARQKFKSVIDSARYGEKRTIVKDHNVQAAAVVSLKDMDLIETFDHLVIDEEMKKKISSFTVEEFRKLVLGSTKEGSNDAKESDRE